MISNQKDQNQEELNMEELSQEDQNQEDVYLESVELETGSEEAPKKKKKLPGWFIFVILAVVIGIGAIAAALSKPKAAQGGMNLKAIEVTQSDVKEVLNTTGVIESENKKVIYSPVNAKVAQCYAKAGQVVKKGDLLVTFDTTDLEKNNQQQQLTAMAGQYSNQDTIEKSNKTAQKASEANAKAQDAQAQIDALQPEIDALTQQVAADGGSMEEKMKLQAQIETVTGTKNACEENFQNLSLELDKIRTEYDVKYEENNRAKAQLPAARQTQQEEEAKLREMTEGSEEYNAQKSKVDAAKAAVAAHEASIQYFQEVDTRLQNATEESKALDKQAKELGTQLEKLQAQSNAMPASTPAQVKLEEAAKKMAALQGELTAAEAEAKGLESGVMSSAQYNAMMANSNITELSVLTAAELVERGRQGITAEFDGVIATVAAAEGAVAAQGMELFTIASNMDVRVKLEVSVNDYDKLKIGKEAKIKLGDQTYNGAITGIDKIATVNAKGNPIICAYIHINNPDAEICIGVNAKVNMTVAEAKNAVAVPSEVINSSTQGEFVYTVKNGVVKKTPVTLGVSSDRMVEITEGLQKGDQVVSDIGVELKDGMKANVTIEEATDTSAENK